VIPGAWRLRFPLPWPAVPHVNAFALTAGESIVLVDTGTAADGDLRPLELALSQIGRGLEDISLLVCTHAHVDHYGLAKPIVDATGVPLWMHPAWEHIRGLDEDPAAARAAIANRAGVPAAELQRYEAERGDQSWLAGIAEPDRELVPGVVVQSDLGDWHVHETPGHAPSHVVLHQPERRLLLSGDHLLGRVAIFLDYGHTPDPVGEMLLGLDRVAELDVGLVLAGHGRTFRDADAKVVATREALERGLERARKALAAGPANAYDLLVRIAGAENVTASTAPFALQILLAQLDRLQILGEVAASGDGAAPVWTLT